MKFKTTKKLISSNYYRIITAGYCDLQYLLNHENPIAYSTRSEGWACDYYDIDGVLISTGYAPLSPKNTKRDYDIIKRYDDQAQKIVYDRSISYEEQKAKLKELIKLFIKEVSL